MDIQRGDQVSYRGEVWTVARVGIDFNADVLLYLEKPSEFSWNHLAWAKPEQVQRVEQVR